MRHIDLRLRVTLVVMVVTLFFAMLTALVLEQAFRDNVEAAAQTRLEAQILLLMGAADVAGPREVTLPTVLPEARLQLPGSGLYARVLSVGGVAPPQVLWRSPSAIGVDLSDWRERRFIQRSQTVEWEVDGDLIPVTFQMLEDRRLLDRQLERYRRQLWLLLGSMTLILLIALIAAVVRWGLRPLKSVRVDLDRLRDGRELRMRGSYPPEIQSLTDSINLLLEFNAKRLERQRNALADLAHSLKTPLSALRLDLESSQPRIDQAREQVDRMLSIIQFQLSQAGRGTPDPFIAPLQVAQTIERTVSALDRIAAARNVRLGSRLDASIELRIEPGALFELLGNVLDNAIRFAKSRVEVTLERDDRGVLLAVDDDGPGFPAEALSGSEKDSGAPEALGRGRRLDENDRSPVMEGGNHGLGLDIVKSLVEDYGGRLIITRAPALGGARVAFRFS